MARLIAPWSVKGIDDETRELARRKAKNSGVNIGAWINRTILDHGSREHSGATDLPNVVGDSIPEKSNTQQYSNDIISQRLQQLNKNLDGDLRPIMFALNNLALRLAAAEVLQKNEPKKINEIEPTVTKPKLDEDVKKEIINEELDTEELINEQPTPSLERPDPFPPAGDLDEEIDVPKTLRQKSNMELGSVPISENRQHNGKSFSVKAFLIFFSLIVFSAVGATSFYFFPQTTNKIAKQINAAAEHHLDAVSQTLNDSLLYSQRLLELFLRKSTGAVETEKKSKIDRGSSSDKEGFKKTESKLGNKTPDSVPSRLVLPHVENSVSKNILALNDDKQNVPISNPLQEEMTQKKTLKSLRAKANNGDALPQYKLGLYWIKKEKNKNNYLKGATWFKLAAVQGLKEAQYSLGVLYDTGVGLEKDENQAFLWYHAAANNNHPMAQFNIANFYLERENGKDDFDSALRWFELASKNGVDEAAHNASILSSVGTSSKLKKSDKLKLYTREPAKQLNKLSKTAIPFKLKNGGAPQKVVLTQKEEVKSILVLSIQKELRLNGFYLGPIDGKLGPNTKAAISVYQLENGFIATGMPSIQLLNDIKRETNK
ncbi:SEL1-like repeat protein [Alphaproteobacteria bacterium]|nr:SEL1-like repeat protein [Alphaproteobacteria bacterium]